MIPVWLQTWDGVSPVLSTRVRLARNLPDIPFRGTIAPSTARELCDRVRKHAMNLLPGLVPVADETSTDSAALADLLVVPSNLLRKEDPGPWLALQEQERGLLVLDGDHLRLWSRCPGLDPALALERIADWDDALQTGFPVVRDPEWGWRTATPTDVGTGMRLSVLLYLPALWLSRRLEAIREALGVLGLQLQGPWGATDSSIGPLVVVSNRRTLGLSETQIIQTLVPRIHRLVEEELKASQDLRQNHDMEVQDGVARSMALIGQGRLVSRRETGFRSALLTVGARHTGDADVSRYALYAHLATGTATLANLAGSSHEGHPEYDDLRAQQLAQIWSVWGQA